MFCLNNHSRALLCTYTVLHPHFHSVVGVWLQTSHDSLSNFFHNRHQVHTVWDKDSVCYYWSTGFLWGVPLHTNRCPVDCICPDIPLRSRGIQNVLCPQMCQKHKKFISCSLVHNFHMCYSNYIVYLLLKNFVRY